MKFEQQSNSHSMSHSTHTFLPAGTCHMHDKLHYIPFDIQNYGSALFFTNPTPVL